MAFSLSCPVYVELLTQDLTHLLESRMNAHTSKILSNEWKMCPLNSTNVNVLKRFTHAYSVCPAFQLLIVNTCKKINYNYNEIAVSINNVNGVNDSLLTNNILCVSFYIHVTFINVLLYPC